MWLKQEGQLINLDNIVRIRLNYEIYEDADTEQEEKAWSIGFDTAVGAPFECDSYSFDEDDYDKGIIMISKIAEAILRGDQVLDMDKLFSEIRERS